MTEYTTSPEAVAQWMSSRARTAHWVTKHYNEPTHFVSPSVAPSLVSDNDDGLSSPTDSDAESNHSLPPRMMLRYPDGRDVPISPTHPYGENMMQMPMQTKEVRPGDGPYGADPWATQYSGHAPQAHHGRARAATHPNAMAHHPPSHPPSQPYTHPYMHSQPPGSAIIAPPPPQLHLTPYHPAAAPEIIQIHPSPTTPHSTHSHQSHVSHHSHPHSGSWSNRSKSLRSNHSQRSRHAPLQMIYAPPVPAEGTMPMPPSHSQSSQSKGIVSPLPIHAFTTQTAPVAEIEARLDEAIPISATPEPPPQHRSRANSSHHSYSHSYPPPAASSRHHSSGSHTRSRSGSSSQQPSSAYPSISSHHRHQPPSIVYAPSNHMSETASYSYNPPVITSRRPSHSRDAPEPHPHAPSMQRTASQHPSQASQHPSQASQHPSQASQHPSQASQHPSQASHRPSQAPPHSAREHSTDAPRSHYRATRTLAASYSDPTPLSQPPHQHTSRAASRGRLYEDFSRTPSPRHRYGQAQHDDRDDVESHSSASTYYVIPSPGQKVKVLGPHSNLSSLASSLYRPRPRARELEPGPPGYAPPHAPTPTQVQQQKRPFFQRLLPHFSRGTHGVEAQQGSLDSGSRGLEGGRRMMQRYAER